MAQSSSEITIRTPTAEDALEVHTLVKDCPPLDVNSEYCYLLLCSHFADTCTIAESAGRIIGFQTGYREPQAPNTLFIWQIAVGSEGRGKGLGKRMIEHLLGRFPDIEYLEQTVTRSNTASRALFESVARKLNAEVDQSMMFGEKHFGSSAHEPEYLLRIGPVPKGRMTASTHANKNQGVT